MGPDAPDADAPDTFYEHPQKGTVRTVRFSNCPYYLSTCEATTKMLITYFPHGFKRDHFQSVISAEYYLCKTLNKRLTPNSFTYTTLFFQQTDENTIVRRSYNTPAQNWLQAIFGTVGKVILCRISTQVAPLIPTWGKMLQTKIR